MRTALTTEHFIGRSVTDVARGLARSATSLNDDSNFAGNRPQPGSIFAADLIPRKQDLSFPRQLRPALQAKSPQHAGQFVRGGVRCFALGGGQRVLSEGRDSRSQNGDTFLDLRQKTGPQTIQRLA